MPPFKSMKTQTILELMLICNAGSLAYAQPGAGKPYDTRDPVSCKSKKEPAKGAPTGRQLREYVLCTNEKVGGGYIGLFQNLTVEIGKSRPYSAWSDSGNTSIDNSQPVYPIRGIYDLYSCRPPGSMGFPAGKNCNLRKNTDFIGICFKTTFNDWSCPVQSQGDGLAGVVTGVPPPK
jgi:hypothetical protein